MKKLKLFGILLGEYHVKEVIDTDSDDIIILYFNFKVSDRIRKQVIEYADLNNTYTLEVIFKNKTDRIIINFLDEKENKYIVSLHLKIDFYKLNLNFG
jgi:hypothetical protein